MPRMRKSPHPKTASLSKWRCFLSKCHWGGGGGGPTSPPARDRGQACKSPRRRSPQRLERRDVMGRRSELMMPVVAEAPADDGDERSSQLPRRCHESQYEADRPISEGRHFAQAQRLDNPACRQYLLQAQWSPKLGQFVVHGRTATLDCHLGDRSPLYTRVGCEFLFDVRLMEIGIRTPHLKPGQARPENDRLMPFCERNPGKPVRAAFQLFATIEIPVRVRPHRCQLSPSISNPTCLQARFGWLFFLYPGWSDIHEQVGLDAEDTVYAILKPMGQMRRSRCRTVQGCRRCFARPGTDHHKRPSR